MLAVMRSAVPTMDRLAPLAVNPSAVESKFQAYAESNPVAVALTTSRVDAEADAEFDALLAEVEAADADVTAADALLPAFVAEVAASWACAVAVDAEPAAFVSDAEA